MLCSSFDGKSSRHNLKIAYISPTFTCLIYSFVFKLDKILYVNTHFSNLLNNLRSQSLLPVNKRIDS